MKSMLCVSVNLLKILNKIRINQGIDIITTCVPIPVILLTVFDPPSLCTLTIFIYYCDMTKQENFVSGRFAVNVS
jgi:hypothetical protein